MKAEERENGRKENMEGKGMKMNDFEFFGTGKKGKWDLIKQTGRGNEQN
jgi:hypothetical protein